MKLFREKYTLLLVLGRALDCVIKMLMPKVLNIVMAQVDPGPEQHRNLSNFWI